MSCFTAQLNGLAANGDSQDWIQLLVLVIFVALYAVGGLIKAKTTMSSRQQQARQPDTKPSPKKETHRQPYRDEQLRHIRQLRQMSRQKNIGLSQDLQPFTEKQPLPQTVRQKLQLREKPEFAEGLYGHGELEKPGTSQIGSDRYGMEISRIYEDTDALKMAVLHYEILGKPLALRNQPAVG